MDTYRRIVLAQEVSTDLLSIMIQDEWLRVLAVQQYISRNVLVAVTICIR